MRKKKSLVTCISKYKYKYTVGIVSHFEVVCNPYSVQYYTSSVNEIEGKCKHTKKPRLQHLTDLILHRASGKSEGKKPSGTINIMRIRHAGTLQPVFFSLHLLSSFVEPWLVFCFLSLFPRRVLSLHDLMRFHLRFRCNQICNLSN